MMEQRKSIIAAVKTLRSSDPQKFLQYFRIHLAVLLELSTEDIDRAIIAAVPSELRVLTKKCCGTPNPSLPFRGRRKLRFGSNDSLVDKLEMNAGTVDIFKTLVDFIKNPENMNEEGIFRKSGSCVREQELKQRLCNNGVSNDADSFKPTSAGPVSVHDCTSVLKSLLRSLDDPLLSSHHFYIYQKNADFKKTSHCSASQQSSLLRRRIDVVKLLFLLLPLENKKILRMILHLLNSVSANSHVNKMDAANLATIFVPCLLLPKHLSSEEVAVSENELSQLLELMIKHWNELFLPPEKFIIDVMSEMAQRGKENDDIEAKGGEGCGLSEAMSSSLRFVDRTRSEADQSNFNTEMAMADLYATVGAMPEGPQKLLWLKKLQKHSREKVRTPEKSGKTVGSRLVRSVKRSCDDGLDALPDCSSLTIESSASWDYYKNFTAVTNNNDVDFEEQYLHVVP